MPNATHRKRLARAYATQVGINYMAALDAVNKAAMQGRLPSRLDDAGMRAALRILTDDGGTSPQPTIVTNVSDVVTAALAKATDPTNPAYHRASDPRDQQIYNLSVAYQMVTGKQGLMYISSPGSGKDRYVFGSTDAGGHVALGREEALTHITELVNNIRVEADRNPYVGDGADGARRSAQIDLEEADGLDRDDPRYPERLASAERWERQAARLAALETKNAVMTDPTGPAVMMDGQCQHATTEYRSGEGTFCAHCDEPLVSFDQMLAEDKFHLEPSYLRRLREVWQGRVTREFVGDSGTSRFAIDNKRASGAKDLELVWLLANDYLTNPPAIKGDEWVVVRVTEFGEDVLTVNGADTDKFTDGLPKTQIVNSRRIMACPIKSLSAGHYRVDGTCECVPETASGEAGMGATDEANPYQNFDITGTQPATVRGLLRVRDAFAKAGRVEWWWHRGEFKGYHGFQSVGEVDDNDGSILLRDEDLKAVAPTSRLMLDIIDNPEAAAHMLIWPDHTGVTFLDPKSGELDTTIKVAPPKQDASKKSDAPKQVRRARAGGSNQNDTTPVVSAKSRRDMLTLLGQTGGRMNVTGVAECRTALDLAADGAVTIESGDITTQGGAGIIALNPADLTSQELRVQSAEVIHVATPDTDRTHCTVCKQRVKEVPGGQGSVFVHTETGAVAAPGADEEKARTKQRAPMFHIAHEGPMTPRCEATSWRGGSGQKAGVGYGPGGYNRCVREHNHDGDSHVDEWGNVFQLEPKFKVLRHMDNDMVARLAYEAGIALLNSGGERVHLDGTAYDAPAPTMSITDLREGLLVQTLKNEVLKVSTVYGQDRVTAQLLFPLPGRTTVREFTAAEVATWREPTDVMIGKYERAWGFAK